MNDLLYFITPEKLHSQPLVDILNNHREIKYVSLLGIDLGGNGTDEKIPVNLFINDFENFLKFGVQTDGSSVVLHDIATLNDARVDIIPDTTVKWFIDYNYDNLDETGRPIGTLRIPSFLIHNNIRVDSRGILDNAINYFKDNLIKLLNNNIEFSSQLDSNKIEDIILTSATELEFWVQTPEDKADIEKLSTSQFLKEQYWKRTRGTVRTALEETLEIMGKYGLDPEMGHKEVGGIKSKIGDSGKFTHIMEQLEIDWKYSTALQAADNELLVREIVGDTFRRYGLEVTFAAKPLPGVAGSGEHTHIGVSAKLNNGKIINLFSPLAPSDMKHSFLSKIGYGALMGFLKNYEVIGPLITSSNDAFNRLKPGFEAPICIVSSLGHSTELPSRNRSVLIGLVRDIDNPLATRFEIRSPNPHSNTYLVLAGIYQTMLDGIKYAITSGRCLSELENELSKKYGEAGNYLEKSREYRSEEDVFEYFSEEERNQKFGIPPETVWESIINLDLYEDKKDVLTRGNVFTNQILGSYRTAVIEQWKTELINRIIPDNIEIVRQCIKLHENQISKDIDTITWERINSLKYYLMKDSLEKRSLFTMIKDSLNNSEYSTASFLQIEMNEKMNKLQDLYIKYKKNLF